MLSLIVANLSAEGCEPSVYVLDAVEPAHLGRPACRFVEAGAPRVSVKGAT